VNERLKKVNLQYNANINVYHFMMLLNEKKDEIKKLVKRQLNGIRIATHTGCHLLRPSRIIDYDNSENPVKFDELIELLGGIPVEYKSKTLCCGNSMITVSKNMSLEMVKDKFEELSSLDIGCLAVCCPSCFLQFDRNQVLLRASYSTNYEIPVIHILQLLSVSFELENAYLNMNKSKIGKTILIKSEETKPI
jgi:heterodisulfide reductase subunit B